MRKKRPASGTGAKPDADSAAAGAANLRIVSAPDQNPAGGGLESMFREISSGDAGDRQGQDPADRIGRYDELWQLALADPLTGLANRMLLLDRLNRELKRCERHGGCVIVSHIDLENLGEINDEFGYSSGNEVLREMCRRLTSLLRSEDTVSRVGESQLVAVMTIENEQAVRTLMERVQAILDEPITMAVNGQGVRMTSTVTTVVALDSESAEEVLARAGHAA